MISNYLIAHYPSYLSMHSKMKILHMTNMHSGIMLFFIAKSEHSNMTDPFKKRIHYRIKLIRIRIQRVRIRTLFTQCAVIQTETP